MARSQVTLNIAQDLLSRSLFTRLIPAGVKSILRKNTSSKPVIDPKMSVACWKNHSDMDNGTLSRNSDLNAEFLNQPALPSHFLISDNSDSGSKTAIAVPSRGMRCEVMDKLRLKWEQIFPLILRRKDAQHISVTRVRLFFVCNCSVHWLLAANTRCFLYSTADGNFSHVPNIRAISLLGRASCPDIPWSR